MTYQFSHIPVEVPFLQTKYRTIRTKIPAPGTVAILDELNRFEAHSMHGQLPVVWDKADDFQVYDSCGNVWIDFTSTIFVANAGHSNPDIMDAIQETVRNKRLHTYTFAHGMRAAFLKKLIQMTPAQFEKAFLLSSGTEATECAIKLIRMNGQQHHPDKIGIVSFKGAMHGRTMGAEMLKGDPEKAKWIGYADPNMFHLPFPCDWQPESDPIPDHDWEKQFKEDMRNLAEKGLKFDALAGFIIESYLGWGAIFYPPAYIRALSKFAEQHNCLVAFDEIQGGFGRTGELFVYQHYGVEPDLLCLGKALSGSLPLSAVIGTKQVMDLPEYGSMSSTHSANPLCCAAGLANLEAIEKGNLIQESARKGRILHDGLKKIREKYTDRITHVLGKGLIAGIILKNPKTGKPDALFASRVCEKAMYKGLLLVHTGRESIKIGPPLTIPVDALEEGLAVLEEAIEEVTQID